MLEDASHAAGASYLKKPVGSDFVHATVFSFHAVKIITTGEGGMVTTTTIWWLANFVSCGLTESRATPKPWCSHLPAPGTTNSSFWDITVE